LGVRTYPERIRVEDPKLLDGKIYYTVKAFDKVGQYTCEKRYNDFFLLHEWLVQRYEGLYIPDIPPKRAMGNKDNKFIEERRFLLQEFLVNLSKHSYLWKSDEFTAWSRTTYTHDLMNNLKMKQKRDRLAQQIQND